MRRRAPACDPSEAPKEVIIVPTQFVTSGRRVRMPRGTPNTERRHAHRVHRLRITLVVWALGAAAATALCIVNQWQANGAFERFGHAGGQGEWNPTLWAVVVGLSGLVVGITALGVHFDRTVRSDGLRRVKFHVAAWTLGMLVLAPINLLIEWQDNGHFERWSGNSRPGSWEPWILWVGGIWTCCVALVAMWEHAAYRRGA
jgi:hypothetical protein